MRPVLATSEIGDSVSMAVLNGIVAGMGRQGAYDPLNPVDIGAVGPEATTWFNPFSGPDCTAMTQAIEFALPMTMHQRLYQWPAEGVGPTNSASGVTTSPTPKEIPMGQADFALAPVTVVAIAGQMPELPRIGLDTETVIPPRGGRLSAQWTVYPTMPWTVYPLIRPVVGDAKLFTITGTVYDATGVTPVAGVRVVAICFCSIGFGKAGYTVAETVSDGSGNYSLVSTSRPTQVQVYKDGSPSLAGVSKADILEGNVPIYLRDPTTADPTPAAIAAAVWTATGRTLTA